jgi:hypothetical protein
MGMARPFMTKKARDYLKKNNSSLYILVIIINE